MLQSVCVMSLLTRATKHLYKVYTQVWCVTPVQGVHAGVMCYTCTICTRRCDVLHLYKVYTQVWCVTPVQGVHAGVMRYTCTRSTCRCDVLHLYKVYTQVWCVTPAQGVHAGVICYVAVGLCHVVTDEGYKTPVQGVHAGRRHDEPGRSNQSFPQLLSRLISNASHTSRCRGDGNCHQIITSATSWRDNVCLFVGRITQMGGFCMKLGVGRLWTRDRLI